MNLPGAAAQRPLALIVDDDATMRLMLQATLQRAGIACEAVSDGGSALAAFAALQPELVLLDIGLPDISGFEACCRLRAMPGGRDTSVLVLTSQDDAASVERAYEAGATDFIAKPINWEILAHRVRYILRAARDAAERRTAQEQLRRLAYHDSLTGLPNRAWLHERIAQALQCAAHEGGTVALMMLDLDRFKRINDTLGHSVGDQLLCAVAQRLSLRLRHGDTVARLPLPAHAVADATEPALSRLGGDEFCIVVEGIAGAGAVADLAKRVQGAFTEPFALKDHTVVVSPSIGIALYPQDAADAENLLRAADVAMYHCKNAGSNSFGFYRRAMGERALHRLTVESGLRRALECDELRLHYQPIVAAQGEAIVGLEALVRWQHPEHGLQLPGRFIEVAEETGLIVPIGEWVLHQACAQSAAWRAQGLRAPPVSVNVSGEQFRHKSLLPGLRRLLSDHRIDACGLKLEITESVLMRDVEATLRRLVLIKEMGVHLSIDDFGTGYSSLSYLKRFPVDELKLDRSFVAEILEDPRNAAIATAVIELARRLSLTVVAEGIENTHQATLLRDMGCPRAQGYYFHRPQPVEEITALLQAVSATPVQA